MRLATWQGASPASDLETGLAEAERALAAAAAMGAAALVLPEVWLPGYNQDDIPARALEIDSAPMMHIAAVIGMVRKRPPRRLNLLMPVMRSKTAPTSFQIFTTKRSIKRTPRQRWR